MEREQEKHEERRSELVRLGYGIAISLCAKRGKVCSNDVWKRLRKRAESDLHLRQLLKDSDERWMGAVFAAHRGWIPVEWANIGSHRRPIRIWTRLTRPRQRKN